MAGNGNQLAYRCCHRYNHLTPGEQYVCDRGDFIPGNIGCRMWSRNHGYAPSGDPAFSVAAPYYYYGGYGYTSPVGIRGPDIYSQGSVLYTNPWLLYYPPRGYRRRRYYY